jgi:polyisoprenoid-binding protein YceI
MRYFVFVKFQLYFMKNLFLFLLLIIAGNGVTAQLKPVGNGTSVQFKVKNFGISVGGSFSGLQGNIKFNPGDIGHAEFNISVDANTVNTENSLRDDHLRRETYFDVKKYPRISFASTKVSRAAQNGAFLIFGKLTIKNTTKDISFPFTAEASGTGYIFKGTFTMNRRDFGVGGSSIISDNLEVNLSVLAMP